MLLSIVPINGAKIEVLHNSDQIAGQFQHLQDHTLLTLSQLYRSE
jgi:hypothetical protein